MVDEKVERDVHGRPVDLGEYRSKRSRSTLPQVKGDTKAQHRLAKRQHFFDNAVKGDSRAFRRPGSQNPRKNF